MAKIQRALLSVFDKTGLTAFAQALERAGVEIISTGGTAKALREAGLKVTDLSAYTGFPEMMDGRVKTLHPKIHGGLLFRRELPQHEAEARAHEIHPIDLVVVNLYPFAQTIARPDVKLEEAIENIDIGGPSMIRSAAKNHESVAVVTDRADYAEVADQIAATGGVTLDLRRRLAARAFTLTAAYDRQISGYLHSQFEVDARSPNPPWRQQEGQPWPATLDLQFEFAQALRYGENPHQRAALYGRFRDYFAQLHGKELSYNNILDLTSAAFLIAEFSQDSPTVAILKHTNPCGVGQAPSLRAAWEKALATDKQAPFGGIIAVNAPLDLPCAEAISEIFSEVIIAPSFAPDALELLQKKKNLRLLKILESPAVGSAVEFRGVGANFLLAQERDLQPTEAADWKIVTRRAPSQAELQAMRFGWRVAKHVKSNAIVFAGPDRTLGIGAGQMSRVDASRIAIWKAQEAGLSLRGSAVCSDAFFPFADGLIAAAEAGAGAAVEPGGSMRDAEVIAAADARNVAMAFTGVRHFRH
jgi:phosphoribosylaminoimidazolecarboxamide formyltransferase/IMP cyclohydrolase